MSYREVNNAICEHARDTETQLSITEFALAEAMMELDKPQRELVLKQVKDEIQIRSIGAKVA